MHWTYLPVSAIARPSNNAIKMRAGAQMMESCQECGRTSLPTKAMTRMIHFMTYSFSPDSGLEKAPNRPVNSGSSCAARSVTAKRGLPASCTYSMWLGLSHHPGPKRCAIFCFYNNDKEVAPQMVSQPSVHIIIGTLEFPRGPLEITKRYLGFALAVT